MMRTFSALALLATASAVPSDIPNKLAGVVVGHMQELNLQQVSALVYSHQPSSFSAPSSLRVARPPGSSPRPRRLTHLYV